MKFLEISNDIEQALIQIFDSALKSGGMSILPYVDKVRIAIQVNHEEAKQ